MFGWSWSVHFINNAVKNPNWLRIFWPTRSPLFIIIYKKITNDWPWNFCWIHGRTQISQILFTSAPFLPDNNATLCPAKREYMHTWRKPFTVSTWHSFFWFFLSRAKKKTKWKKAINFTNVKMVSDSTSTASATFSFHFHYQGRLHFHLHWPHCPYSCPSASSCPLSCRRPRSGARQPWFWDPQCRRSRPLSRPPSSASCSWCPDWRRMGLRWQRSCDCSWEVPHANGLGEKLPRIFEEATYWAAKNAMGWIG